MSDSLGYMQAPPLPVELLLHIFKLATVNPCRYIDRYVGLPPFEAIESGAQADEFDAALKTKYSIALTSSGFRRICAEIMYEDVRVGRGADALADILELSEAESPGFGQGRTVRRAVLIPIANEGSTRGRVCEHTRRILECCPNIRALSRPRGTVSHNREDEVKDDDNSEHAPSFRSLERIDWFSCPADDPPLVTEMPRSVWSSDSLRTLSVGVQEWSRFTGMRETETISVFSNIHTLRVRSIDAFGLPGQRLFTLELPSFRRLILDQPDSMYALFSIGQYGNRVDTIEFGLHSGFLEHDYILVLLIYCPNTTNLYFPIFTTFVTRRSGITYKIKHIGLHAGVTEEHQADDSWKWCHLSEQFDVLCGDNTRFSMLERVTLFGSEWREFVDDPRFRPIFRLMHSKGIALSIEDEIASLKAQQAKSRD